MEIYLYWSKIAPLLPRELEEQMQYLPSEKRQRLQRMHSKERMLASLWAERLLRYGLWRQYGRKAEGMERDVTSQGKPFFADGKIHFSLSHSGAYALAALSRQTVGADIQEVREVDMASIARRVFALREYEAWRTVQEETVRKQLDVYKRQAIKQIVIAFFLTAGIDRAAAVHSHQNHRGLCCRFVIAV